MVRPSLGHESEPEWGFYGFPKTETKKKVWIVGGGLAGLQCGMIAAEKGHQVTVFDRNDHLGGQFAAASHGPWGDEEFMRLVHWGETMCRKHGAEIRVGTEVTREMIDEAAPDVVVMATGAVPRADVPGADQSHVVSCLDVLDGTVSVGRRVVIVGGKGTAISTALFLIENSPEVEITMIDPVKKLGLDVNPSYIWRYRMKLKQGGVVPMTRCRVVEIRADEILVETPEGEQTVPCETVILADMQPHHPFKAPVREGREVYTIGDALIPRRGNSALQDGYRLGMSL